MIFRSTVVRALASVVRYLEESANQFTSQLLAAFQSAFAAPDLRDASLDGWDALLETLDAPTLGPLLDHIVLALTSSQLKLSPDHRRRVMAILKRTFTNRKTQLEPFVSELIVQPQDEEFRAFLRPWATTDWSTLPVADFVEKLIRACAKESPLVVECAILRLKDALLANEDWVPSMVLSDTPDSVISNLLRVLMDTCVRFREENPMIAQLCTECIGLIGAIDPARLTLQPPEELDVNMDNFTSKTDAVNFVCKMIEKQLLPAFKASQDPMYQDPVAYAIQELLKFCGFTPDVLRHPASSTDPMVQKWREFPPNVAQMLQPLLVSRYSVGKAPQRQAAYPIFRSKRNFREWSKTFAADLIGRIPGGNPGMIFAVCESVVKNDIFGFSSFLLPHLVLSIVYGGSQDDKGKLALEILSLLEEAAAIPCPDDVLQRMCQVRSEKIGFHALPPDMSRATRLSSR